MSLRASLLLNTLTHTRGKVKMDLKYTYKKLIEVIMERRMQSLG